MSNNRLRTRLLVQCITDAKLNNCKNYEELLNMPDSWIRAFIFSVADVMDKELRNLAKRMNKKIENHSHPTRYYR